MAVKCRTGIKRVYEEPAKSDGVRILVDRLWPRGLSKDKARIDLWLKEIAPSEGLRTWFGHRQERWEEFRRRYRKELEGNAEAVCRLKEACGTQAATLLFGAHDEEQNNAAVLREYLEEPDT